MSMPTETPLNYSNARKQFPDLLQPTFWKWTNLKNSYIGKKVETWEEIQRAIDVDGPPVDEYRDGGDLWTAVHRMSPTMRYQIGLWRKKCRWLPLPNGKPGKLDIQRKFFKGIGTWRFFVR